MPGHEEGSPNSGSTVSFEKLPHDSHEYPLDVLGAERPASRQSAESDNEPLLPTSARGGFQQRPNIHKKRFCSRAGISSWVKGPSPPHKYRINPWFFRWQTAPGRLVDRYFPSKAAKIPLLLGVIVAWGVVFISVLHSTVTNVDIAGYGNPVKLSCVSNLW